MTATIRTGNAAGVFSCPTRIGVLGILHNLAWPGPIECGFGWVRRGIVTRSAVYHWIGSLRIHGSGLSGSLKMGGAIGSAATTGVDIEGGRSD
jgi:hypothetical protein